MNTIKSLKYGAAISLALIALSGASFAQTANSNSNSTSGSNSASGSSSRASAAGGTATGNASSQTATQGLSATTNTGVTLNQNSTTPATTSSTLNDHVSGGTSSTVNNTGFTQSDVTVRTTPTVYAPPVSGGNPCTLAVSGGVSVIGWGAAAGGTFVDQDCANRQKIAMIHNAGYQAAAKELMCNDHDTYMAFRSSGQPCAPRPQWEAPGAPPPPMVQQQPQPVPLGPQPQTRTTSTQGFQPSGRFACMDARGREVKAGTPGASCGYI